MRGEQPPIGGRPEPSVGSYPILRARFCSALSNGPCGFSRPHPLFSDDTPPKVKMTNRDNLTWKHPRPDTAAKETMNDCIDRQAVKIISSAEGKDLTPGTTGPLDTMVGN